MIKLNLRRLKRKKMKVLIELGVGVKPRLSEEEMVGVGGGNNIEWKRKGVLCLVVLHYNVVGKSDGGATSETKVKSGE